MIDIICSRFSCKFATKGKSLWDNSEKTLSTSSSVVEIVNYEFSFVQQFDSSNILAKQMLQICMKYLEMPPFVAAAQAQATLDSKNVTCIARADKSVICQFDSLTR